MQLKKMAGLLLIAAVTLASCGKKGPTYAKFIPKEASYVVALDVKEMVAKLEKDSLSVENLLTVLKDSSDPSKYSEALEIWTQFKDAGLDWENKVLMAIPSFDMNAGDISFQVVAGLKDAKKLEDFLAKSKKAPKVQKDKDLSYVEENGFVLAWTSDVIMIVGGGKAPVGGFGGNTQAPIPGSTGSALEKAKKYFALSKDQSIASVDKFNDLLAEKADVAIYTNSSSMATANPALAAMPKVKELLEGIYSTSTINFDEGKITMEGNTYVGKVLADTLSKYKSTDIDMSLLEPYPSNNVSGLMAFNFNPGLIKALVQASGFDALAGIALAQQGLSLDDIIKLFKGDVAVVFSDFGLSQVQKEGYDGMPYTSTEPNFKVLAAIRIGDKAAFDKLVAMGEKMQIFTRQGNKFIFPQMGSDSTNQIVLGVENDVLIFSKDAATYNAYVAKSAKIGLTDEAKSAIKGNAYSMFVDFGKILGSIPESVFDSSDVHEKNLLAKAKTIFKTATMSAANFDGKKALGKGELTLEKGKNSLSQLVSFLMYAAEEMKQKDAERTARYKEEWSDDVMMVDSTTSAVEAAPAIAE